jgi:hypothetical protein
MATDRWCLLGSFTVLPFFACFVLFTAFFTDAEFADLARGDFDALFFRLPCTMISLVDSSDVRSDLFFELLIKLFQIWDCKPKIITKSTLPPSPSPRSPFATMPSFMSQLWQDIVDFPQKSLQVGRSISRAW